MTPPSTVLSEAVVVADTPHAGVTYLRTLLLKDGAVQTLSEAKDAARACGARLYRVVLEEIPITSAEVGEAIHCLCGMDYTLSKADIINCQCGRRIEWMENPYADEGSPKGEWKFLLNF